MFKWMWLTYYSGEKKSLKSQVKSKKSIIVSTTQWCDPQRPQCDDRNLENYILYHFPRIRDTSFNHEWNFWVFMSLMVTYGHVAQWGDLYFLTFFFIFHQAKDIWAMPLIFLQIQVTAAFECRGDIELNAFPTSSVNLRRGLEHLWSFQKQHPGINKIKCFQPFFDQLKFCGLWVNRMLSVKEHPLRLTTDARPVQQQNGQNETDNAEVRLSLRHPWPC